jgi:hypothetical protein
VEIERVGSFVRAAFPDALRTETAPGSTRGGRAGYRQGALLVTGSCRDERASVRRPPAATWGSAFHIGSLGGLLFLGRTGTAPPAPPREPTRRYLIVAAHVGFGADGTPSRVGQPHQDESSACGARCATKIAQVELAEVDRVTWSRACCAVVSRTCGPPAPTSASSTSRSRRATRSART